MRAAIYRYLTDNCQSVRLWKQPYQAAADTPKPYGVIVFEGHLRSPFNRRGSFQGFTTWVYVEPGSYVPLDEAVSEVKALMRDGILTTRDGRRFLVEWIQDGRDFYDDDLQALTKYVEFRIPIGG